MEQSVAAAASRRAVHPAQQPTSATQHVKTDQGSLYYQCWLTALERMVVSKGLADPSSLLAQKEAWAEAYRTTPHGLPVELPNKSAG
jgi:hypothetical protein